MNSAQWMGWMARVAWISVADSMRSSPVGRRQVFMLRQKRCWLQEPDPCSCFQSFSLVAEARRKFEMRRFVDCEMLWFDWMRVGKFEGGEFVPIVAVCRRAFFEAKVEQF